MLPYFDHAFRNLRAEPSGKWLQKARASGQDSTTSQNGMILLSFAILPDHFLGNKHASNTVIYDSTRTEICMAINRAMTFQDETTLAAALFLLSLAGARASFGS